MKKPSIPDNEEERLKEVRSLNLLYTPAEERFDRIIRIAANALDTEFAAFNIIHDDDQWAKSRCGSLTSETKRENSFCGHAILEGKVMIVPDAKQDPRFSDNPLVTGEPGIRFYMGAVVRTPGGFPAGALCAYDQEPREPTDKEVELLKDLRTIVEDELSRDYINREMDRLTEELETARRSAAIDDLTQCWNRSAMEKILEESAKETRRDGTPFSVGMLDIDHFKGVNDEFGHVVGDRVLVGVTSRLRRNLRPSDCIGRYGGEEFLIHFSEADRETAVELAERIRQSIAETPFSFPEESDVPITTSIGVTTREDLPSDQEMIPIIQEADEALYRAKQQGRNQVVHASSKD